MSVPADYCAESQPISNKGRSLIKPRAADNSMIHQRLAMNSIMFQCPIYEENFIHYPKFQIIMKQYKPD